MSNGTPEGILKFVRPEFLEWLTPESLKYLEGIETTNKAPWGIEGDRGAWDRWSNQIYLGDPNNAKMAEHEALHSLMMGFNVEANEPLSTARRVLMSIFYPGSYFQHGQEEKQGLKESYFDEPANLWDQIGDEASWIVGKGREPAPTAWQHTENPWDLDPRIQSEISKYFKPETFTQPPAWQPEFGRTETGQVALPPVQQAHPVPELGGFLQKARRPPKRRGGIQEF